MAPAMGFGRPGAVTAAAIVLIAVSGIELLVTVYVLYWLYQIRSAFSGAGAAPSYDLVFGTSIPMQWIALVACGVGIAAGVMLLRSRTRSVQIFATVAGVVLILSGLLGFVALIAIPILLWAVDTSRAWFTPAGQYGVRY